MKRLLKSPVPVVLLAMLAGCAHFDGEYRLQGDTELPDFGVAYYQTQTYAIPSDLERRGGTEVTTIPPVRDPYGGSTVLLVADSTVQQEEVGNTSREYLSGFLVEAGFELVNDIDADLEAELIEGAFSRDYRLRPDTATEIRERFDAQYVILGRVTDYRQGRGDRNGGRINVFGTFLEGDGDYFACSIQIVGAVIDIGTREILAEETGTYRPLFDVHRDTIKTPWGVVRRELALDMTNGMGEQMLELCVKRLVVDLISQLNTRRAARPGKAP